MIKTSARILRRWHDTQQIVKKRHLLTNKKFFFVSKFITPLSETLFKFQTIIIVHYLLFSILGRPEFYLAGNPFVCDCELEWMRGLENQSVTDLAEVEIADVKFCTAFVNVTKPYKLVEKYDNINDLTMFVSKICD